MIERVHSAAVCSRCYRWPFQPSRGDTMTDDPAKVTCNMCIEQLARQVESLVEQRWVVGWDMAINGEAISSFSAVKL